MNQFSTLDLARDPCSIPPLRPASIPLLRPSSIPPVRPALFVAFFLALLGCDQVSGPETTGSVPPVVTDFSFTPTSILLGESGVSADGETVTFSLSMEVRVLARNGGLRDVAFVVQSPFPGRDPVAKGELGSTGEGRYERTVEITVPRGEVGVYTVLVYAVGSDGQMSDAVRGILRFLGSNSPPVILDVAVPDTVIRPAAGEPAQLIRLVATVDDPDGLSNVNEVRFWNVNNPGVTFPMFDDGRTDVTGDETAGDGRYTALVRIESTNQPGETQLAFQATDRAGLKSEIVYRVIVVL